MKAVKAGTKQVKTGCLKFRHLLLSIVLSQISFTVSALTLPDNSSARTPASALDEVASAQPIGQAMVIQSIFAEDEAGIMKGIKKQLNSWEETETYAKVWNLNSTNLYKSPKTSEKTKFIMKNLLKYVDKRVAGQIKKADNGSPLHAVGEVEKSLRSNSAVPVSKDISLKFKVRVLQGRAVAEVKNPWLELNATMTVNGQVKLLSKKDFNQLGLSTGVEYKVNESQWTAFVDQEINKNIKARISSTSQTSNSEKDKRLEILASFPFNL